MTETGLDIYGHLDDEPNEKKVNHYAPTIWRMGEFVKLLPECGYNIRATCRSLGITPSAYYRWLKSDPEFAEFITSMRNDALLGGFEYVREVAEGLHNDERPDIRRDRLQAAIALIRLEKMSSVNISTNDQGNITGFEITFV